MSVSRYRRDDIESVFHTAHRALTHCEEVADPASLYVIGGLYPVLLYEEERERLGARETGFPFPLVPSITNDVDLAIATPGKSMDVALEIRERLLEVGFEPTERPPRVRDRATGIKIDLAHPDADPADPLVPLPAGRYLPVEHDVHPLPFTPRTVRTPNPLSFVLLKLASYPGRRAKGVKDAFDLWFILRAAVPDPRVLRAWLEAHRDDEPPVVAHAIETLERFFADPDLAGILDAARGIALTRPDLDLDREDPGLVRLRDDVAREFGVLIPVPPTPE